MMRLRLSFLQEALLAAAAGLAVLLLVEAWLFMPVPERAGGPVAGEAQAVTVALGPEEVMTFALPPRDSLRDFVERPLFEKARQSAAEAYAPKENVALIGIVFAPDEKVAILRTPGDANPVRARMGDAVGDWRVVEITQNSVLLRNNDTVKWVSLP